MRAFQVYLNGKKLCVAGVGTDGVLSAIVSSVARSGSEDLFLDVGGLVSPTREHFSWIRQKPLGQGDTIKVRVIAASTADKPKSRKKNDPVEDLKAKKRYVREMARQFGWKIQAGLKKSPS